MAPIRSKPSTPVAAERFQQKIDRAFERADARIEGWHPGNPAVKGEYLAIDHSYWHLSVAYFSPERGLGWCINGKWLGHDAVAYWREVPAVPPRPRSEMQRFLTQPKASA